MMKSTDHGIWRACGRGILVAGALALLGGCSSVPDAVNPVEWYKGTRDWISGDDNNVEVKQAKAKPVPGADKPFPTLNAVPDRPAPSIEAERDKMASTLVADRDSARYSDEKIRRQTTAISVGDVPRPRNIPASIPAPAANAPKTGPQSSVAPRPVTATIGTAPRVPSASAPPQVAAVPRTAPPTVPQAPRVVVANQPVTIANAPPRSDSVVAIPVMPHQPVPVEPVRVLVPPPRAALPGARQAAAVPPLTSLPSPPMIPPLPRAAPPAPSPLSAIEPSGGGATFTPANRFSPNFPAVQNTAPPRQFAALPPQASQPSGLSPTNLSAPIATIRFATGSARLGGRDRRAVQQVYQAFRSRGGRIHVLGHASSRTRNMNKVRHQLANFQISYDRARAVADELIRLGVDPAAIVVNAMSDQHPAFFEVMPAGEAGNRRTEIFLEN